MIKGNTLPLFYPSYGVGNEEQATLVALHHFMLEYGFILTTDPPLSPPSLQQDESSLEADRRRVTVEERGLLEGAVKPGCGYRLVYTHPNCDRLTCAVILVRMSKSFIVSGSANDKACSCQIQLKIKDYITSHPVYSDYETVYKNMRDMSVSFKNNVVLKLLSTMRSEVGGAPLHSLLSLSPEILVYLMMFVDVRSISSLSLTCVMLHDISEDALLWKSIAYRDFHDDCVAAADTVESTSWKEFYKEKFKKSKPYRRTRSFDHCFLPMVPRPLFDLFETDFPPYGNLTLLPSLHRRRRHDVLRFDPVRSPLFAAAELVNIHPGCFF